MGDACHVLAQLFLYVKIKSALVWRATVRDASRSYHLIGERQTLYRIGCSTDIRVVDWQKISTYTRMTMLPPFSTARICPLLLGRTPYLAALDALIAQAYHGRGQTVLITGEAGIGKSRLV